MKDTMEWHHRMGVAEGRKAGRKEGKEEGKVKGREKGIEEGIRTALTSTAKNLLKLRISVVNVTKATGLSVEQVEALKSEI